jgi:hypothetical protein
MEAIRNWLGFAHHRQEQSDSLPEDVAKKLNELHIQYRKYLLSPPQLTREMQVSVEHQRKALETYSREVGSYLDRLSCAEKQIYISTYCAETGFPNLKQVSNNILDHATLSICKVAEQMNVPLLYIGYDPTCSVGTGLAIPGSDIDGGTILIEDETDDVREFERMLISTQDPRLININECWGVFTSKKIREFIATLRLPQTGTYQGGTRDTMWTEGDIWYAGEMVTNINSKSDIINNLGSIKDEFRGLNCEFHQKRRLNQKEKDKYRARYSLIAQFQDLPIEEKFALVRIMQIHPEALAFDITATGPNREVIESLKKKKLLELDQDHLKAPWGAYPWLFRNLYLWFYDENNLNRN